MYGSTSTRNAHRPRRPLLPPAGVFVAVRSTAAVTGLTFAAAAPPMVRTVGVSPLVFTRRRIIIACAWIGWCALRLSLYMSYARVFWPGGRLVGICVHVSNYRSGRFSLIRVV